MAKSIIPDLEPPEPVEERAEEGAFSSPPCFMHELAPEYLGYMSRDEVAALLAELRALEAEDDPHEKMAELLRRALPRISPSRMRDELEDVMRRCGPGPEDSHVPVRLKRIYEPPDPGDGVRIFVERLWPRGVSRKDARLDEWARDLAPSTDLRRWYAHIPERWPEFRERYRRELASRREALERLRALASGDGLTLVYAARDERRNSAVVLKEALEES